MPGQLSEIQINNLLASQVIGRLACTDGVQPYIVPVTYAFDGEYIYGQTNEGNKLRILRKNPAVCFEIDKMIDISNWQSIIIYGKFEELQDEEATNAREYLFTRVFPMMTVSKIHTYGSDLNEKTHENMWVKEVMYRIKINRITGRFETK
jgi:uncharacterized protein